MMNEKEWHELRRKVLYSEDIDEEANYWKEIDRSLKALDKIKEEMFERLMTLDRKLVRAMGQYKMIQAGYIYGRMVELESLYGEKLILPGMKLLRNFCNEVRKTNLYVNKIKLEE